MLRTTHKLMILLSIVLIANLIVINSNRNKTKKQSVRPITKVETVAVVIDPTNQYTSVKMTAVGYAIGSPYSSITKSGHPLMCMGYIKIGDENIFTVAADKHVIPLGSLIYIDNLGIGMVQDTGSGIVGNTIDICFQTIEQAMQFGRRDVKIFVLRRGN